MNHQPANILDGGVQLKNLSKCALYIQMIALLLFIK